MGLILSRVRLPLILPTHTGMLFHTKACTKACGAYLFLCCQHRLPVLGLSGLGPRRLAQQQVQEDVEERDQVIPGWTINGRTKKVSSDVTLPLRCLEVG